MRLIWLGLLVCAVGVAKAESRCFQSAAEAVRGVGVGDQKGFRVVGLLRDQVGGKEWFRVGRCGHPEWPERLFPGSGGAIRGDLTTFNDHFVTVFHSAGRDGVVTGGRVRVVMAGAVVRMDLVGVVERAAGLGERVKVRLVSGNVGAAERTVEGVVRSAELVEMEEGR